MIAANQLKSDINAIRDDLVETRHRLHERPELSYKEEQTAAFVAERLRALGLAPRTGIGGHGVVAEIEGTSPGRTIAIRADMDALPIEEANEVEYRSRNPGVMHACGHDGHTTVLLGTARTLLQHRESLAGRVRLIFQPAEEVVGGAKKMCEDGVMEGVDAVVALHGWPGVGLGQVGLRAGAMMASADRFDLIIKGAGAHAAYPHQSVDPIVIGAQIVTALQILASREVDPLDPVVVTVAQFHAGTAYNVIPGEARLHGTVRTLNAETRLSMPDRVRRIADGICAAGRATCEFKWIEGTPPVVNEATMVDLIRRVAAGALGDHALVDVAQPSMGAEDFAMFLEHAPGAMFRLGLGDTSPIHTPTFDFTDDALPIGVELFSRIAIEYLSITPTD